MQRQACGTCLPTYLWCAHWALPGGVDGLQKGQPMVALLARRRITRCLCCCILKHVVYRPLGGGPLQDGLSDLCDIQKADGGRGSYGLEHPWRGLALAAVTAASHKSQASTNNTVCACPWWWLPDPGTSPSTTPPCRTKQSGPQ
jgi:hypothetical protein